MSVYSQLEKLYSGVVADVLDKLGYRNQTLGPQVKSLTSAQKVFGRVFTARAAPVDEIPAEPYKLEMQAIDTMQEGDVLVVDGGNHQGSAFWGELLSTACKAKGVRGVVMTLCTRDLWALNQMDFPVFGTGSNPADSLGRIDVVEIGTPITIDGVKIRNGDLILGDLDGVVIVPAKIIDDTIRLASEKISGENRVRDELAQGIPVAEVFRRHGIL